MLISCKPSCRSYPTPTGKSSGSRCRHVYVHVDVPGNEDADRLSKVGRMSQPLFPTKATPALQVITTPATPKVKRAKNEPLPKAPHTPLLPKILDFLFFAISSPELSLVPCESMHELWNALGMQPMPRSPRDSVHSDCSWSTNCSCELVPNACNPSRSQHR